MQIILFSLILVGLLGYIVFKVSDIYHISLRKIMISLTSVFVLVSIVLFLSVDKQEDFEELFKEKYQNDFGFEISKITSEEIIKNQVLSQKDIYYKFTYIVKKDNKTYVCEANNIRILKIEDEFVLQNIKEVCTQR